MTELCSQQCFLLFHLNSTPLIVPLSLFSRNLQEANKSMNVVVRPCRLEAS